LPTHFKLRWILQLFYDLYSYINQKMGAYRYRSNQTLLIICLLLFSCIKKEAGSDHPVVSEKTKNEFTGYCLICDSLKGTRPYEAITACDQALETGKDWADKSDIVKVLCNKASAFSFLGNYTEQLKIMLEALRMAEGLEDIHLKVAVLKQLAICNYYLGYYKDAIKIDEKILEVARSINDTVLIAGSLNNIGDAYEPIGNPRQEIKYYEEALTFILDNNGNPRRIDYYCTILGNIGVAYKKLKQYDKAMEFTRKSMNTRKTLPHKGYYAGSLKDMGIIYEELGQPDSAIYYQMQCISEVKDIDGREWLSEAYAHLQAIYVKQHKWDSAYKYQELYIQIENERNNLTTIREQGLLQARYEHETMLERERIIFETGKKIKEDQIAIQRFLLYLLAFLSLLVIALFFRSSVRNKKTKKLNAELETKNQSIATLMKEIHHRVKNNLQVISSILSIQQRTIKNEEFKEAFKDANSRIGAMALVHQSLYEKENLDSTNAQEYFEQLFKSITTSYAPRGKKIVQHIHAEDISLNIDTLIPLALIVNELLTNSYKYAFLNRDEGIIDFKLIKKEGQYHLQYKDDGPGLPEGFKMNQSKGLGGLMIEQLTIQLFGSYTVISGPAGIHFHFIFKGL
jgi:two-component sensor histidine kinase/tetratricopeptide (TPR) repeat protein